MFVGNIPPVGGPVPDPAVSKAFKVQGYGFACGSEGGSNPAYAGGEKNRIYDCKVYGVYKCVAIDDDELSPISAAYTTEVISCDLQTAHDLIYQGNRYGAGNIIENNILQDVRRKSGVSRLSSVITLLGYQNRVRCDYVEAGSEADRMIFLGPLSKENGVVFGLSSATTGGAFVDQGTQNRLDYLSNTGALPGGYQSGGKPIRLRDNAHVEASVFFSGADPSTFVGTGIASVSRIGVGDYNITFEKPFRTADSYMRVIEMITDASAHFGVSAIRSYSASSIRIVTGIQNGATTTQIDPIRVWLNLRQI